MVNNCFTSRLRPSDADDLAGSARTLGDQVMRCIVTVAALLIALTLASTRARADIVITVDKSAQRLTVEVDGITRYQWPVSTARMGYRTPNGSYRPERLERKWFSRKYDWSPMPYSIFFNGGYAIHGSYEISHLGRPASHGCIRLHPANAAVLYALVKERVGDTRIVVTGDGYVPDAGGRSELRERREIGERREFRRTSRSFEEIFESDEGRRRSNRY